MRKIFSAKSAIILISFCSLATGVVLACADGWGEEYGTSNFTPEVFVAKPYSPFFYSMNYYYGINYDESQNTRFNAANVSDWSGFLGNAFTKNQLAHLLQQATTESVDSAADYIIGKSKSIPVSMDSFAVFAQKKDKKVKAFFEYLKIAKQCEGFAVNEIKYAWYDTLKEKKVFPDPANLDKELNEKFAKTKDVFLKQRYWFQVERFYFFNDTSQKVIDFFNLHETKMPHNTMYYRVLSYVAGAYHRQKDYGKANYYYSLVYDGCDDLKVAAEYSFHPQEEKDWNVTLALCKNSNEKETLWQMLGAFYKDEKRAMEEIYKLNPASEKLDLLLARAINKYEQKFTTTDNGYSMPASDSSTGYNEMLRNLITRIANAGNTDKPWIWYAAAGYIKTLDDKYDSAKIYYAKAEKILPNQELAQSQMRILKLINRIGETKKIDAKFENEITNEIVWLKSLGLKDAPLRSNDAIDWLKRRISSQYKMQKEFVKAECFLSNVSFYAEDKNVEDMKAFLNKKNRNPFEKLCAELSTIKMEDILEYQAIKLALNGKLEEAIEKMNGAGDKKATTLLANPFNGTIQDCHDCDFAAPQKIKYTKLLLLIKMKEIKDKINAGDDVYNNSMLLANVYYNITVYGNARDFYECAILGESYYSSDFNASDTSNDLIFNNDMAYKYYSLCLAKSKTDEQKAKCYYMQAKCERNKLYNQGDLKGDGIVNFNAMNGFKNLKQLSNTQYYKDVIKECGYFRMYISGKK